MTLADIFEAAGVAMSKFRSTLAAIAASNPDHADEIAGFVAKLDQPMSAENLTAVLGAIPAELADIVKLQFHGVSSPSNLA